MVLLKIYLLESITYPVANRAFPFTIIAKTLITTILAAVLTVSPIKGFLKPLGIRGSRLSKLFKKVQNMERRLANLEILISYTRYKPNYRQNCGCPSQVEWAALKSRIGMDVASRASRKRRKVKQQQPENLSEDEISNNY
ncbi:hypothetical protein PoMZ_01697 [Pyricularia oryzae]|uniref:Uncharacterized protein n=1 Tax=Pyricularia oryzae TaxID=318829 RepID=A0A4P7N6K4_PYROR|nr:hypothetical protein PoMZ_01697 [Pyricularia oryzae]